MSTRGKGATVKSSEEKPDLGGRLLKGTTEEAQLASEETSSSSDQNKGDQLSKSKLLSSVIASKDPKGSSNISSDATEPHSSAIASLPESSSQDNTESNQKSYITKQVIAVSASKGPAAYFNLARKFLVTDEMCDLSALEGAIVSAVDAAHLLERSKLAEIVRIQTSYVAVEPKRRQSHVVKEGSSSGEHQPFIDPSQSAASIANVPTSVPESNKMVQNISQQAHPQEYQGPRQRANLKQEQGKSKGSQLRRARIIITVKRTQEYKRWLNENPYQAMIEGDI